MNEKIWQRSSEFLGPHYQKRLAPLGKSFAQAQTMLVRAHPEWQPAGSERPKIAIVGTRRPTAYGLRFVSALVAELARYARQGPSPVVVSGGALGIDGWAHECALRAGLETEAWVVGPILQPNPRSHARIFESIVAKGGALICPEILEPSPSRPLRAADWVMRNAYLVARADVVIVPEANEKSGTWSSVQWAGRMDIPVFALPGSIEQAASQGANLMISSGYAHPIGSAVKLMADLVVWGVLRSYNDMRSEGSDSVQAFAEVEQKLNGQGGLQVADLPGLAAQMGLKLDALCEYLWNEAREGKLRRVGNGFERRG